MPLPCCGPSSATGAEKAKRAGPVTRNQPFYDRTPESKLSAANGPPADIAAAESVRPIQRIDGLVSLGLGFSNGGSKGCDTQHPATGGEHLAIGTKGGTGMEHRHTINRIGIIKPADLGVFHIVTGITPRCHHHAERCLVVPAQIDLIQRAIGSGNQGGQQVRVQAGHQRLAFRIAEANVEFQGLDHRTIGPLRDHQTGKQHTLERAALGSHALDGRIDDVAHHYVLQHRGQDRGRGIGPHATSVGAGVAIANGLVILRRHQWQGALAVANGKEADLFTIKEFLDHHLGPGLAKATANQRFINGGDCLLDRAGNSNALASGKTIGLDHDGSAVLVDEGAGGLNIGEPAIGGSRHAVFRQNILHKALGPFKGRSGSARAKSLDANGRQLVNQTQNQRNLGADHDETDVVVFCKADQRIHILGLDRNAGGHIGDPGIARRAIERVAQRRIPDAPAQRVLAPTRSHHKDFHGTRSFQACCRQRALYHGSAMTQDLDPPPLIAPDPRPGSNLPEYSVGDLARRLKRSIEDQFGFVRVRGEISQPKRHSSGHCYLRLKDDTAVVEAVAWRGTVAKLAIQPQEGLEVVVTGRMTTYPGRSQYQLIIESMELAGEGALLKMLEERKRRLTAEGLFDAERKKPLPFLPDVIGVITSPTGAVIRDILHRLHDRFPRHVLLWPVAVQGDSAARQVADAIDGFNRLLPGGAVPRPDLLIVARGGGSLEDLMAFNEEIVVRAAAASTIALISAVGHETDTTLIDFASDKRAPTPTAAAEMAVPVRAELLAQVLDCERRLVGGVSRMLGDRRNRVEGLGRGLGDPRALLEAQTQRLDDWSDRIGLAMAGLMERRRTRLTELSTRLRHPREKLAESANRLASETRALESALRQRVTLAGGQFERVAGRLSPASIRSALRDGNRRIADLAPRLTRAYGKDLGSRETALTALGQLLESYSYKGVLARGFAVVQAGDGKPLTSATQAAPGTAITLVFGDGQVDATVHSPGDEEPAPPAKATRATRRKAKPADQGSLF